MKLIALIMESPAPEDDFIIVEFRSDKSGQHFQVFIEQPFLKRIRKYDEWLLDIKFRSIVMKDLEGNKTYDTQLYSEMAVGVTDLMRKKYK
ncbi:hypothetical protein J8J42_04605 [Chryseobacterium sp. cx-311]|uniref:hypothetical protein n=1 Tax=Marnyiella aurantia TaxID=2758037 RepID=UPI001AE558F7|nr:hypothetical protein [Marnyiella aurantia]MBP0612326.1 hypothetical protein [Marnyiella aurantia]